MLKIIDVKCEKCGHESEQWIKNEVFQPCEKCGEKVKKLLYNNQTDSCGWSDSGYASSRYWDKVNEERSKGKNVEPTKC